MLWFEESILGPMLFRVYMDQLLVYSMPLPNCDIFAFADDTTLLIYGNSWMSALGRVLEWL